MFFQAWVSRRNHPNAIDSISARSDIDSEFNAAFLSMNWRRSRLTKVFGMHECMLTAHLIRNIFHRLGGTVKTVTKSPTKN